MRRAVVLHHPGMINRNVGGSLIEIGYWIATGFHDRGRRFIICCHSPLRGIDKARLYRLPLFRITFVFRRVKIADLELFNPLLTIRSEERRVGKEGRTRWSPSASATEPG